MSPAYGAALIEHSLMEAGLPGSLKIDGQTDISEGTVARQDPSILLLLLFYRLVRKLSFYLVRFSVAPKVLEALQLAETYLEKTERFSGKVSRKCPGSLREHLTQKHS